MSPIDALRDPRQLLPAIHHPRLRGLDLLVVHDLLDRLVDQGCNCSRIERVQLPRLFSILADVCSAPAVADLGRVWRRIESPDLVHGERNSVDAHALMAKEAQTFSDVPGHVDSGWVMVAKVD